MSSWRYSLSCFMHPKDLLNLARTSKSFRALLMSKSAKMLWRASMERVEGLPECPPYLNAEPAFVNLFLFTNCHACLKSNVQSIIFEYSARYCSSWKPTMLLEESESQSFLQDIRMMTGSARCSSRDSMKLGIVAVRSYHCDCAGTVAPHGTPCVQRRHGIDRAGVNSHCCIIIQMRTGHSSCPTSTYLDRHDDGKVRGHYCQKRGGFLSAFNLWDSNFEEEDAL
ncbi:hypothetical protein C8Q80DRAFT_712008 [Daedaleopsis nitida]|nr:hypothetical protein C8Q80DRAFT_712008 [Daedaleopsis nitida]